MDKETTIKIWKSKSGLSCLWETGGAYTNTGSAQIICNEMGQAKKAIYIKRKGDLACGAHALIPVQINDILINASQHRGDFNIDVWKIVGINNEHEELKLELIQNYSEDNQDDYTDRIYVSAINAAKKKSEDYHCRYPYFIKIEEKMEA
jgi:hypothetical protein